MSARGCLHGCRYDLDPIPWTSSEREYDGHDGGHQRQADPAQLHGRLQGGSSETILDEGKTVAAAARDLGLTESSLRNWVEQARADRTKGRLTRSSCSIKSS